MSTEPLVCNLCHGNGFLFAQGASGEKEESCDQCDGEGCMTAGDVATKLEKYLDYSVGELDHSWTELPLRTSLLALAAAHLRRPRAETQS